MNNTAIIILAAGNASRFGSAKQLLRFSNKTLLQHVVDEAIGSGAEAIMVVTGAYADEVLKDIKQQQVQFVYNDEWKNGMASGIIAGVSKMITINNAIERIIIAVCDQPFVSADIFRQLYQQQQDTAKNIIASSYADTMGTPALFTKNYFDALMSLKGDEGAKKILKANKEDVATIDFPQGAIDIDTQKDYEELLDNQKHIL